MIVYLGLGSNIEPFKNIENAKKALSADFERAEFSRSFESEAVGFKGDNFINLVARVETDYTLEQLIQYLKMLEDSLGRVREGAKFSSRHIDIDILLYGDLVCEQPIKLPREEINENAYVLWPLAEIAPDLIEPGGSLTYRQLWDNFENDQNLQPID